MRHCLRRRRAEMSCSEERGKTEFVDRDVSALPDARQDRIRPHNQATLREPY